MADDARKKDEQRAIEREIRASQGFTLARALAGQDGGGHLRGASPTPVLTRASLTLETWLKAHLDDREGCLARVVGRMLADRPELLTTHPDQPAALLAAWLPDLLADPARLAELVRQADVEWGRLYDERPHFERDGAPPHPDDPYTRDEVSRRLTALLATARAELQPR